MTSSNFKLKINKKTLKKLAYYMLAVFFIFLTISSMKIFLNDFVSTFDSKIRDYMFIARGEIKILDTVVIVDIDEKSLSKLGQWPWSRDKVSKILENLSLANVGVIGLDIVFAELDHSSPAKVFKDYNITSKVAPDFDEQFNFMVKNTPTILGYQFVLTSQKFIKQESISIPAIIVEKNKDVGQKLLIEAKGTVLNHTKLQDSAYSSGFFNNIPDANGVIRSVPLLIKYDEQLYPSLALEIIRASMGINTMYVNYSDLGIENIQIGKFNIPTDRHGRFMVNFRGPNHTFKYYSAVDIYNNNFDKKDFDGKVVLVGTTASGLNDARAIPFEPVFPGVEVHANIIDNIISQDFLYLPTWIDGANLVFALFIILVTVSLVTFSPLWFNPLVLFIMSTATLYAVYYALFTYGIVLNVFLFMISIILAVIVTTFMDYIFEIKEEQAIKDKFATKVSKDVMNRLIDNEDGDFTAIDKEVTIFVSNIRNFSYISQSIPSARILIEFLNEYVEPMTKIIIQEHGTIDKFMGDSIMAYWNAPADVENHASKAVNSALKQLYKIKDINKLLVNDKRFEKVITMCAQKAIAPLDIGIGINTGHVAVGEMGSSQRSDYTIIGDSVNIGFKLESLCKYYGTKCNISNFTKWQLEDKYIFRYLDLITIKGYEKPLQVWEVIDFDDENLEDKLYIATRERLDEELSFYHIALDMYQNGNFEDALISFQELNTRVDKTNDKIYDIYIQRCEYYIQEPPVEFNGVFEHTTQG